MKCSYLQESGSSRGRQLMYKVILLQQCKYILRCASCHVVYFVITFINVNSAAFIFVIMLIHNVQARADRTECGLLTPWRSPLAHLKLCAWMLLPFLCGEDGLTLYGLGGWHFFSYTDHITPKLLFIILGILRELFMCFRVTDHHYQCENVTWK